MTLGRRMEIHCHVEHIKHIAKYNYLLRTVGGFSSLRLHGRQRRRFNRWRLRFILQLHRTIIRSFKLVRNLLQVRSE